MRLRREGFGLPDTLVGLWVGLLVVGTGFLILQLQLRTIEHARDRIDRLEAVRVARWIIEGEVRGGGRVEPIPGSPSDREGRLAVRSFRGWATVCGRSDLDAAPGGLPVQVRGHRRPDAAKDSVLFLDPDGRWRVARLLDDRATASVEGCEGEVRLWRLDPEPRERPVFLRYFERGRYAVANRAFRYGRPLGGEQPLTDEVLPEGAELVVSGPGGLGWVALRSRGAVGREGSAGPGSGADGVRDHWKVFSRPAGQ